jgi:putative DNA primase/helicase
VKPEDIPGDLKALPQWVVWRYWWDDDADKWTKPPLRPKDGNATSHNIKDQSHWSSFDFAYQRYLDSQSQSWRFNGIGLVLLPENRLVGFDIDHCRDPETGDISPFALSIIKSLPTYWEISPSGTGLRGFASGQKPGSRCRSADFEMYACSRFLCISGHRLEQDTPTIQPIQDAIDAVYHQIFPPTAQHSTNGSNGHRLEYPDVLILDAARREKHATEIIALYDHGDLRAYVHDDDSPDASRADAALLRRLAFYTTHEDQLDRLFRGSALNRPKWESRADYRQSTIAFAIQNTPEHWQGPSAHMRNGNGHLHDDGHATQDTASEDIPIHLTDRGNALRLVNLHGKDLHYIYRWKKWLVWDGTRWVVDEGNLVERLAKQVITQLYLSAQHAIGRLAEQHAHEEEGSEDARKLREQRINQATATLKWALKSESAERLSGMLKHARSEQGIAIIPEQLDANPWILNCLNGTIDLKTGTMYPQTAS